MNVEIKQNGGANEINGRIYRSDYELKFTAKLDPDNNAVFTFTTQNEERVEICVLKTNAPIKRCFPFLTKRHVVLWAHLYIDDVITVVTDDDMNDTQAIIEKIYHALKRRLDIEARGILNVIE